MKTQHIQILQAGGVGILLTDTLYGVVGQALNKKTVSRIYTIKGRNKNKPLIILISAIKDLELFGITIDKDLYKKLRTFWPGPVSIIFPCSLNKFKYLHRGTETLAFRLPNKKSLIEIIRKTGPLVAPSANPEGMPPAESAAEALNYFGRHVDFYEMKGKPKRKASCVIMIRDGEIEVVRA